MGAPELFDRNVATGAPVGTLGGTTNTIPRWTGASTLGDSLLSQSGTTIVGSTMTGFGIGTTVSPWGAGRYALQVGGSPTSNIVGGSPNTVFGSNQYHDGTDARYINNGFAATYVQSAGEHRWATAASGTAGAVATLTQYMVINSSGNVGIGTASPAARLDVSDTANQLRATVSNSTPAVTTYALGTREGYISARQENSGSFNVFTDIVSSTTQFTPSGLRFFTHASGDASISERARFDSSGDFILNTANTGATIQAAGTSQGLKLQGTGGTNNTDPNVLDFYADGGTANSGGVTWTPTLNFGGATTGITYATQVGRYTRIGNTVIAHGYIQLSSKGSATGVVTITGLPTSSNTANLYAAASLSFAINITTTGQLVGRINPNEAQVRLGQFTVAGTFSALTDAAFANNSEISFTISYPVN